MPRRLAGPLRGRANGPQPARKATETVFGSTRAGRNAGVVMKWLIPAVQKHRQFELDLRDRPLPMFQETVDTVGDPRDPKYSDPFDTAGRPTNAAFDPTLTVMLEDLACLGHAFGAARPQGTLLPPTLGIRNAVAAAQQSARPSRGWPAVSLQRLFHEDVGACVVIGYGKLVTGDATEPGGFIEVQRGREAGVRAEEKPPAAQFGGSGHCRANQAPADACSLYARCHAHLRQLEDPVTMWQQRHAADSLAVTGTGQKDIPARTDDLAEGVAEHLAVLVRESEKARDPFLVDHAERNRVG